jgi:preprotein translocase subunit SecE
MGKLTKNSTSRAAAAEDDSPGESGGEFSKNARRPPAADDSESPKPSSGQGPGPRPPAAPDSSGGFFHIYKRGQGYWTRMGTVGGAALIGALTLQFIYSERQTFRLSDNGGILVCVIFAVVYAAVCFYVLNKPRNADFLIATDSEMKKVNWTTRKELIGSTKIVILFMFLIAIYLFACDLLFGGFFHLINVLKTWF